MATPGLVRCSGSTDAVVSAETPTASDPRRGFGGSLAKPKSRIFAWPRGVIKIFAGLMSRWTMPFVWAASSASAICVARSSRRSIRRGTLGVPEGSVAPTAVQISGGPVVAMLQRMGLGGPESRFREQVGGWGGTVLSKFTPRLPPAAKAERGGPVLRPEGVGKADRAKRTDRDRRRVAAATKPPNWIRTSHRKLATAST